MFDETSDILGGHTLPKVRVSGPGQFSVSITIKFAFIPALVLVGYVLSTRAWEHFLKWRERTYKLSMRRRHGIPDNDRRPFNVAYAAVIRARQDHEAADRSRQWPEHPGPSDDQYNALPEQSIKQRPSAQRNVEAAWPKVNGLPGRFNPMAVDSMFGSTSSMNVRPSATPDPLNFSDRYNPNPPIKHAVEPEKRSSLPRTGPSRGLIRKNLSIKGGDDDGRKRAFDEDDDVDEPDNVKKTKVEGDELIDGDEDPEWQEWHQQPMTRGSKRLLREEDGDDEEAAKSKRKRDKRPRKISIDRDSQTIDIDHVMDGEHDLDVEDEDEVTELKSISRGKKRDRAEAGSTFGGDDEDSALDSEGGSDAQARRRRKRRSVNKRKSDVGTSSRGRKRDRDVDGGDSDGEDEDGAPRRLSRKKRGKKVSSQRDAEEQKGGSDVSMDDSVISKNRGRRVGEEWESNGVRYKVGPNGQRLRQALVKKARQKFTMPQDSQHPDRNANLEVCVETWLTEDEFKEAKTQHLLAWQDSPKPSVEPETPTADVQESPSPKAPVGKNLLWGSPASSSSSSAPSPTLYGPPQGTPTATPETQSKPKITRDAHRHSIATNVGLRINPFQEPPAPPNRRVASTPRVSSVYGGVPSIASTTGLADSTNSSPRGAYRMFSKWEKQELEAEAMRKMREANRKKEKEREEKEREEKEKKEKAAAALVVPSISITKPTEDTPAQSENKPPPTLSFTPLPAANASKPPSLNSAPSTSPKMSFTTPTASASTTTQQKAQFKPPAQNTFDSPSGTAASSSNKFSFAKESAAEPPPSTINTGTAFGMMTRPVAASSGQKHATPTKPSGFTLPSSGGNAASGGVGGTPASVPSFSFAPPAQSGQPTSALGGEQKKSEGSSLLSRVGGFAGGTEGGSGSNSGPTQAQPQPQQGGSAFSFNKPPGEAAKPSSAFGSNTSQSMPPPAAPPATSGSSSGLKFNFGFSGKAASSTSTTAAGATPSSSNGAPSTDPSKPNLSSFGFAPSKASATSTTSAEPTNGTTAPKFNFGTSPSTSAFANPSGAQKSTPSTQPKDSPAKSAFAGFGSGSSSNSAFSNTAPAASSPAFGSGTTTNVFGGSNSTFGASGSKTAEAPKTPFSFGTPAAASSSATATNGDTPKSAFSFPSTTPSGTPAPASSAFSFKFGDSTSNNSTQGAQPPSAQSGFGSKPGAGAFGFGTTPASGQGALSGFGGAPKSTGQS